ncbi:hypothetical protein D3C76_1168580 [compost metagenome]
MQGQFVCQHLLDCLDHHRVVVAQRQSPGPGQAVDELTPFDIFDIQATGLFQRQGNASRVTAGIRLLLFLPGQQGRLFEVIKRFGSGHVRRLRQRLGKADSD